MIEVFLENISWRSNENEKKFHIRWTNPVTRREMRRMKWEGWSHRTEHKHIEERFLQSEWDFHRCSLVRSTHWKEKSLDHRFVFVSRRFTRRIFHEDVLNLTNWETTHRSQMRIKFATPSTDEYRSRRRPIEGDLSLVFSSFYFENLFHIANEFSFGVKKFFDHRDHRWSRTVELSMEIARAHSLVFVRSFVAEIEVDRIGLGSDWFDIIPIVLNEILWSMVENAPMQWSSWSEQQEEKEEEEEEGSKIHLIEQSLHLSFF